VLEKKLDFLEKAITIDVHNGKALFTIFPGLCKGCGLCKEKCPEKALDWSSTLGVYGTPTISPMWNSVKHAGSVSRSVRIVPLPL